MEKFPLQSQEALVSFLHPNNRADVEGPSHEAKSLLQTAAWHRTFRFSASASFSHRVPGQHFRNAGSVTPLHTEKMWWRTQCPNGAALEPRAFIVQGSMIAACGRAQRGYYPQRGL